MRRQLDTYSGGEVYPGDTVYIRATVCKVVRSEELLVAFRSKTTEIEELVATELCELDFPDLGEEAADGSILLCRAEGGTEYVFRRDDAEGHNDRDTRRYDRHWWSYVDQTWVDWAHVAQRGGRTGRLLTP